jgi:hypothetical protein
VLQVFKDLRDRQVQLVLVLRELPVYKVLQDLAAEAAAPLEVVIHKFSSMMQVLLVVMQTLLITKLLLY